MSEDAYLHNPVCVQRIAAYLRQHNISPLEIFRRAGIPPAALMNPDVWVPRDLCFALGAQIGAAMGERFIGAKIGQPHELSELNTWGRAILAAGDLRRACEIAMKGIELLHQGTDLRLLTFSRHVHLRVAFNGTMRADPLQHLLGALVILRKIALLPGSPEAVSVQFSMPCSRYTDELENTHGSALEFGCAYDAIVIDREVLDQPLNCTGDWSRADEVAGTATAIGALVKPLLPYGNLSVETIATLQRISVRTLQRRLREWGFAFEEIVDDIRRTEGIRLLLSGEHSAVEIAFLLGYSDPSHLARAFKRWTGVSPREYAKISGGHARSDVR